MPNSPKTQKLYQRAKEIIPGGTQLLSKRPEMHLPGQWPAYYEIAQGCRVTDLDGNTYVDMGTCGIGSTVLGYADPDVNEAVVQAVRKATMTTLNCPEEVELAERLVDLHPWAGKVRFCRSGGEAMSIAVRIARAARGKDKVAFCGYHGWHDWYLSANLGNEEALDGHLLPGLEPAGVPRALRGLMIAFTYNDRDHLERIFAEHGNELAAVVMEPVRSVDPEPGFLETVRELCTKFGVALIFDEITCGFRMNTGGVHMIYGVEPDIAVFAKALGNGFPISAVIGRAAFMSAAQSSFISSTMWTERVGPAAGLATLKKHERCDVGGHLVRLGERIRNGWKERAQAAGLAVSVSGLAPLSHLSFDYDNAQAVRTLFTQLMLGRGFLALASCYLMFAHSDEDVDTYLESAGDVFKVLRIAIDEGAVEEKLVGGVAHSGFRRLV